MWSSFVQVPVVTATVPVDPSCQYREGSFPHFRSLADSIMYVSYVVSTSVATFQRVK